MSKDDPVEIRRLGPIYDATLAACATVMNSFRVRLGDRVRMREITIEGRETGREATFRVRGVVASLSVDGVRVETGAHGDIVGLELLDQIPPPRTVRPKAPVTVPAQEIYIYVAVFETTLLCGWASAMRINSVYQLAANARTDWEEDGPLLDFTYGQDEALRERFPELTPEICAKVRRLGALDQLDVQRRALDS